MTNKERFLAGHVFYADSFAFEKLVYRSGCANNYISNVGHNTSRWYCNVIGVKEKTFLASSVFFHKIIKQTIYFERLIFVEDEKAI
nr:hypothetical protein [Pedobacter kyonggii]